MAIDLLKIAHKVLRVLVKIIGTLVTMIRTVKHFGWF
jgi:hypothetical protein